MEPMCAVPKKRGKAAASTWRMEPPAALVMAISVGSTAFGPVLFALVHDATGSYNYALLGTAVVPILVAVVASNTQPPAIPGASNPPIITRTLP
jgi:hypothetical protein